MKMWQKSLAYVAPNIGLVLLIAPVAVLGGIYAKYYGLSLSTIGAVMLLARLFDAVTDPLVAYYSDRQRVKIGTRKPMIIIGAIALVPCSYFLFVPRGGISAGYFTFWYMAFYLALTIFIIPYTAWANEFTDTSEDKTLVFSMMGVISSLGGAMFYVLPLLPFFITTEITPEILKLSVLLGVFFLVPGIALALNLVPSGPARVPLVTEEGESVSTLVTMTQESKALLMGLASNKPFMIFILAMMCSGMGFGMWAGLFFIYVDTFLRLGAQFAELSMWGMVMGAAAIPIWYRLAIRWGKRRTWLIGMALLLLVFFGTSLLQPGPEGFYALFALKMLLTFAGGSGGVVVAPMLCDVIDYGRLKDGAERSAVYFAILGIMTKVQAAIGGALGFMLVGWFGFEMQATEQTAWSIVGLHISVAWAPMFFVVAAMILIAKMPLTEARMKIVRRKLKMRDERLQHSASHLKTASPLASIADKPKLMASQAIAPNL